MKTSRRRRKPQAASISELELYGFTKNEVAEMPPQKQALTLSLLKQILTTPRYSQQRLTLLRQMHPGKFGSSDRDASFDHGHTTRPAILCNFTPEQRKKLDEDHKRFAYKKELVARRSDVNIETEPQPAAAELHSVNNTESCVDMPPSPPSQPQRRDCAFIGERERQFFNNPGWRLRSKEYNCL